MQVWIGTHRNRWHSLCPTLRGALRALLLVAGVMAPAAALATPTRWRFTVGADPALTTVTSTLCIDGRVPARLFPTHLVLSRYLKSASKTSGEPLPTSDGAIVLRGVSAGQCVRFAIDLEEATKRERDADIALRVGRDVLLEPDLFLWLARPAPVRDEVHVRFALPDGIRASVPWPSRDDGSYRVTPSTYAWQTLMALGRFTVEPILLPGGALEVVLLDHPAKANPAGIERWVREGGFALANLHGRLPVPRARVIVQPVRAPSDSEPVVFGAGVRGGGPTVHLLLADHARDEQLTGEWILVHELSHLAVPFLARDAAWLAEGLATYYQNVLRARRGMMTAEEAWERIDAGFERGRKQAEGSALDLERASARMNEDHAYYRVYWSGAAIALAIDLELRSQTRDQSLDTAIAGLREAMGDKVERPSAEQALAIMDRVTRTKIPSRAAERWLRERSFPEVAGLYQRLGLRREGARMVLDARAVDAKIAAAIMARP